MHVGTLMLSEAVSTHQPTAQTPTCMYGCATYAASVPTVVVAVAAAGGQGGGGGSGGGGGAEDDEVKREHEDDGDDEDDEDGGEEPVWERFKLRVDEVALGRVCCSHDKTNRVSNRQIARRV